MMTVIDTRTMRIWYSGFAGILKYIWIIHVGIIINLWLIPWMLAQVIETAGVSRSCEFREFREGCENCEEEVVDKVKLQTTET
jgi:hypothetical protein